VAWLAAEGDRAPRPPSWALDEEEMEVLEFSNGFH